VKLNELAIIIWVFAMFLLKCTAYKVPDVLEEEEAKKFRIIAYNSLTERGKNLCAEDWLFSARVEITSYNGKAAVLVIMPNDDGINGPDGFYIDLKTRKILGEIGHL
jgi:hypothetical protein